MKETYCKDCTHFRQHYIRFGYRYDVVSCGHCVYPRLKHRKPNNETCAHFRPRKKAAP